jgi:hypothetical protein
MRVVPLLEPLARESVRRRYSQFDIGQTCAVTASVLLPTWMYRPWWTQVVKVHAAAVMPHKVHEIVAPRASGRSDFIVTVRQRRVPRDQRW